jgi:hypothetical protein
MQGSLRFVSALCEDSGRDDGFFRFTILRCT